MGQRKGALKFIALFVVVIVASAGVIVSLIFETAAPTGAHFGFPSQQKATNLLKANVTESNMTSIQGFPIYSTYAIKQELVWYNSTNLTIAVVEVSLNTSSNASLVYQASIGIYLTSFLRNPVATNETYNYSSALITVYTATSVISGAHYDLDEAFIKLGNFALAVTNFANTTLSSMVFKTFLDGIVTSMT